jgi:hypothetical protein
VGARPGRRPTRTPARRPGCHPPDIRAAIVDLIDEGGTPERDPDQLLATLGIDLREVRRRAEANFGTEAINDAALHTRARRRRHGPVIHRWWPGCDQSTLCRSALLGHRWLGIAPRVKRVVEIATDMAAPHPAEPMHLLLSILIEGKGVACEILTRRSVNLPELTAEARARLPRTP